MSVEITRLDNGLRVVSHNMPHLETASLGVWVNVGARAEMLQEHGLSHLLEHMAFKGTPKRSALQIAEDIEAVGGDLNAGTSFETTCYYARVLKDDVPLAVDILGDILQNPLFDEQELVREKEVIFQEITASFDSPDDIVFDLAQQMAYQNQPLGRPILGTIESVSHIQVPQLRDYMTRYYTADNMVISAAGAIEHQALVSQVEKQFSKLNASKKDTIEPATYCGGLLKSDKQFEQSHIIIAFEGFSYKDESYYAGQVFNMLMGGGMSSRLFQEVREKRGLCYSIYSFCWGMADTGLFGIHAATGPDLVAELSEVVVKQLKDLAEHGPSQKELDRSKAQLKAGLLMSLESSGARAEQLARHMLIFDRPMTNEELIERVNEVDAERIRKLVQEIITRSVPTCSGAGPLDQLKSHEWLKAQFAY